MINLLSSPHLPASGELSCTSFHGGAPPANPRQPYCAARIPVTIVIIAALRQQRAGGVRYLDSNGGPSG